LVVHVDQAHRQPARGGILSGDGERRERCDTIVRARARKRESRRAA
jgi:hypothetical protein